MTLTKLGLTAIAVLGMALTANAVTILSPGTQGTQYELGTIDPGQPSGGGLKAADQAEITQLIGMNVSTTATVGANFFARSANAFNPLPAPILATAKSGGPNTDSNFVFDGIYVVIDVGAGYNYLIAKWDGPNNAAQAWDIAGLTGLIKVPYAFDLGDPGHARNMTAWTIWNPTTSVPDGGSAIALLGMSMVGVEVLRRRFFNA